jgi:hypothetical protein
MIKQIRYIFVVVVVVVRSDINHIKLQLHIVKDYKLIYKKKKMKQTFLHCMRNA